ncbi:MULTISPECIES: hydrolase [unclassified Saccharibacter]|uniref:hydrolase n=1 Tax=unclassified Saccharibacter TaxID=2648722 RepID=UPI00132808D7|nr:MULTISPECIES: hydrolase [unclassified Saccharibacter]MXV35696.1 hydrolase [Saccharibacter sp. EH611]MXV58310.1 hydrolase [Saccharibacter sp. EH70]MXV65786.1 hydrolase [Saccharibacter sp. EH60]
MLSLPSAQTALVLIDLQNGIVSLPTAPYSGQAVVERSKKLAHHFREYGSSVFLVNVAFSSDGADALQAPVDRPLTSSDEALPSNWSELVDGLAKPTDLRITKHQWGAFFGTELDLQLRRRGITTLVIGGIATNFGVESTARAAHEHGYNVVLVEDATTSLSPEMHRFAYESIFPALGRTTTSDTITLTA